MSLKAEEKPTQSAEADLDSRMRGLLRIYEAPRKRVLWWAASVAAVILFLDSLVHSNISIGILYIIPILLAAPALNRWQVLLAALFFAALREDLAPFGLASISYVRVFYAFISFAGAGLFAGEIVRSRRMALKHSEELQDQVELRREAENQLITLIESSPAAIITLDAEGRIDLANQAAHELFRVPQGSLPGMLIRGFLPVMSDILTGGGEDLPYRTAANCRGHRADGETFLACVWFATFPTREGKRLAAIVTDSSDEMRDWQETSLQSLLRSTRVLVGSVSHEIRNICAAISVVHANLGRIRGVSETEDYIALGTLSQGLARLATVELHSSGEQEIGSVNLESLLEEFRIVEAPALEAAEISLTIDPLPDLPHVLGDHHGFLQVLLNLARNSIRALENSEVRLLHIAAEQDSGFIVLRFRDSGPGVLHPERLFQPFQQGADAVGLGLFVSRAIVRACNGELYHEPSSDGCVMCLKLKPVLAGEAPGEVTNMEIPA